MIICLERKVNLQPKAPSVKPTCWKNEEWIQSSNKLNAVCFPNVLISLSSSNLKVFLILRISFQGPDFPPEAENSPGMWASWGSDRRTYAGLQCRETFQDLNKKKKKAAAVSFDFSTNSSLQKFTSPSPFFFLFILFYFLQLFYFTSPNLVQGSATFTILKAISALSSPTKRSLEPLKTQFDFF